MVEHTCYYCGHVCWSNTEISSYGMSGVLLPWWGLCKDLLQASVFCTGPKVMEVDYLAWCMVDRGKMEEQVYGIDMFVEAIAAIIVALACLSHVNCVVVMAGFVLGICSKHLSSTSV